MQLRDRANIRVPGQYTEREIAPHPGVATFVHPTIPYNLDLPPAAFPTLDFPSVPGQLDKGMAALDPSDSALLQDTDVLALTRKATVFRDQRISPETSPLVEQIGFEASASSLANGGALKWEREKLEGPDGVCCGSLEHLSNSEIEEKGRMGQSLEVLELTREWPGISDGLKLIIVSELSKDGRSFDQVMKLLGLPHDYINEFVDINNRELLRREEEEERIARSQSLQLKTLMGSACAFGGGAFADSLEKGLYADLKEPAAFILRKDDVERASSLLRALRLTHLARRLWSSEGVAQSPNLLYGPASGDRRELVESPAPKNVGEKDLDAKTNKKSKKVSIIQPAKRLPEEPQANKASSGGSRLIKLRLSSGLRTVISGENLAETTSTKPAALQSPADSQARPAPPLRKKARSHNKYVKPTTEARHTVPVPAEGRGQGESLAPIKVEDHTATKTTRKAKAGSARSKMGRLRHKRRMLEVKIARRIQASREKEGDDSLYGPLEGTMAHETVDEVQTIAEHAPAAMRAEESTNVPEEKRIRSPALALNGITTHVVHAQVNGQQSEVPTQGIATHETAVTGKEKCRTVVVQVTRHYERKQQDEADDDSGR